MNIIEVNNLTFRYGGRTAVLKDLSFKVAAGSFLAVAGPNGAGKTTLVNLLCGLLKQQAGSITISQKLVHSYSQRKLAQQIAVVRQEFVPVFGFTVAETVMMARTPYLRTLGFENEADHKITKAAMEETCTIEFSSRTLAQLSGGERQRVAIARAFAQDTAILLLDEPTTFLDLKHQVTIYDLLKKMQLEKNKTIIAVTHDINLAAQYCDEVLLLGSDGTFHTGTAADVFTPDRIEEVFGVAGFAAKIGQEKFFLPLGEFAKDRGAKVPKVWSD